MAVSNRCVLPWRKVFACFLILGATATYAQGVTVPVEVGNEGTTIFAGGTPFRLWQIHSNNAGQQMMSYVIQSGRMGKVIVIDGGMPDLGHEALSDPKALSAFIGKLGNRVNMWFITHQHPDHAGALKTILGQANRPKIDAIYGSFLTSAEIRKDPSEPIGFLAFAQSFTSAYLAAKVRYVPLTLGWVTYLDGIKIEVLSIKNPELRPHVMNNSSVVLRVSDGVRSILFTGDLEVQGGNKLLKSPYKMNLPSDDVQMSHHGSFGVENAVDDEGVSFYALVGARNCLWPTTYKMYSYRPQASSVNRPAFGAYPAREAVEAESLCGAPNSGRHFLPFNAAGVLRHPLHELIP